MRITVLLIACAPALMAFECNEYITGSTLPRVPENAAYYAAVEAVAEDWRSEPTLPDIDTSECREALAEIDVRVATETEWIERLRQCPRMPDGCSIHPLCVGRRTCTTGTFRETRNRWRVILSPGEDASGHEVTVRHEVAHILHACSVGTLDVNHTNPLIWRGADSVVWRDQNEGR